MTTTQDAAACIHACQMACGRQYDVVIVQAVDGSCMFYCIPCFQQFAYQMMRAMVEPADAQIQEVVAGADLSDVVAVSADAPGYSISAPSYGPGPDDFDMDEPDLS